MKFCWRSTPMDRFFYTHFQALRCNESSFHLAFVWISGLISGALCSFAAGCNLVSLMRMAVLGHVSIINLLLFLTLPLFFSAFAVYTSQSWLLIPIAFCKAFLFTYLGFGLMAAFGSAGWLIHLLFMFSDILTLPLLWSYWKKALSGSRSSTLRRTASVLAANVIIGCVDYRFISPFLANLIS